MLLRHCILQFSGNVSAQTIKLIQIDSNLSMSQLLCQDGSEKVCVMKLQMHDELPSQDLQGSVVWAVD